MSISQLEASEKLTSLAFSPSYQKAPFSTLFDHVKDNAIRLDQTKRLLQTATCRAHEGSVKAKERQLPLVASSSGTHSDHKVFLGRDGKQHAYLIPPDVFKKMTAAERKAKLTRLKAAHGNQVSEHTAHTVVSRNTAPASSLPANNLPAVAGPNKSILDENRKQQLHVKQLKLELVHKEAQNISKQATLEKMLVRSKQINTTLFSSWRLTGRLWRWS
jgi:hypothetical protein